MVLANPADPGGELLGQGLVIGPVAIYDLAVPGDPLLAGFQLSTQALHLDWTRPWDLSNAIDLVVGHGSPGSVQGPTNTCSLFSVASFSITAPSNMAPYGSTATGPRRERNTWSEGVPAIAPPLIPATRVHGSS